MTALDLITSSMRLIGVLASGETPTSEEANDALEVLNDLLEEWAHEELMLYRQLPVQVSTSPGVQAYTIGTGGVWDVVRPLEISGGYATISGTDFQVEAITADQWNAIDQKTAPDQSTISLYYDPSYPLGTVYLWPVPATALQITLITHMQFSQLVSISDSIAVPPGYKKALRYALAVELAPEYGVAPSDVVVATAVSSKGKIKVTNSQPAVATFDPALLEM